MDLELENVSYVAVKEKLDNKKKRVAVLEKEIADLEENKRDKEEQIRLINRGIITGNKGELTKELEDVKKDLKTKGEEAKKIKEEIEPLQKSIDAAIARIKENPEMKEQLEGAVSQKVKDEIEKKNKAKEALADKQKGFQTLAKDKPAELKAFYKAGKSVAELDKELKSLAHKDADGKITYTNPVRATEINNRLLPTAAAELRASKDTILKYVKKKKLKLDEQDIEAFSYKNALGKNGKLDIDATLNKQIATLDKKIARIDEKIAHLQTLSEATRGEEREEDEGENNSEEQPKPWQIFKRFKNWLARRKQAKLADEFERDDDEEEPADRPSEGEEHSEEGREHGEAGNEFKESLKYDVFKAAVKKQMEEDRQTLAQARRDAAREAAEQPGQEDDDREP